MLLSGPQEQRSAVTQHIVTVLLFTILLISDLPNYELSLIMGIHVEVQASISPICREKML